MRSGGNEEDLEAARHHFMERRTSEVLMRGASQKEGEEPAVVVQGEEEVEQELGMEVETRRGN